MMESLPPAQDETEQNARFVEFGELWERATDLHSVVNRLPGQLVLKSGLSARRSNLLERWDEIETPEIDGEVLDSSLNGLRKWINDAEVLISYIINIYRNGENPEYKKTDDRVRSGPIVDLDDLPQVINSIEEADGVNDAWCWPWSKTNKSIAKKEKSKWSSKEKIVKIGIIGAIGLMTAVTLMEED